MVRTANDKCLLAQAREHVRLTSGEGYFNNTQTPDGRLCSNIDSLLSVFVLRLWCTRCHACAGAADGPAPDVEVSKIRQSAQLQRKERKSVTATPLRLHGAGCKIAAPSQFTSSQKIQYTIIHYMTRRKPCSSKRNPVHLDVAP